MLSEQNDKLAFENEYTGSTENVLKSVLLGKADAGAIFSTELNKQTPDILEQIRTILKTEKIPSHPLAAHPRVPHDIQAAVKKAVLALSRIPEGQALLQQVRMPAPVAADYAKDYQALEQVDVKGLSNWGE
ncbi:MAG: phosphate/phosphite/phosphonate ABC transporter substrate-binding protein [Desulfobulbaceae bacterium]|nr:phosphate/phosphite/phosphonate ABC transporter substrate-binding protein [Desulfobulbaceae bacterium]